MFRILSFVILIAIVIGLIYGLSSNNKKDLKDTHDIATGYTIDNLFVIETNDVTNKFSGFAHSFYLYVSSPYKNETSLIKRSGDDDFNIKLNNHNILTVNMENTNSIEYMMPLGKWTHVVVNVSPHALELYIDGSLLKSNINSQGLATRDYYGTNINIGDTSSTESMNGWIASYSYFDSPLPSDKINIMYQSDLNKYSKLKDQYGLSVTFNKNKQEVAKFAY